MTATTDDLTIRTLRTSMATPGAGRDEYPYDYQGYGTGSHGITGRANATHPENYAPVSQSHHGYYQAAGHPHHVYHEQDTFHNAGFMVSGYNTHPQLQPAQNYPAGSPSYASAAQTQSQAPSSYAGSSVSHSSGSQQGRTTYRRRPMQAYDDSDEGMSDADDGSPTIPSQGHGGSDFSNLTTHSRRKMYVVGLEDYINVSRETLVQNGRELPRVQRAAASRGLNGPTKIDILKKMERRNTELRATTRSKEESSSMSSRSNPKSH